MKDMDIETVSASWNCSRGLGSSLIGLSISINSRAVVHGALGADTRSLDQLLLAAAALPA